MKKNIIELIIIVLIVLIATKLIKTIDIVREFEIPTEEITSINYIQLIIDIRSIKSDGTIIFAQYDQQEVSNTEIVRFYHEEKYQGNGYYIKKVVGDDVILYSFYTNSGQHFYGYNRGAGMVMPGFYGAKMKQTLINIVLFVVPVIVLFTITKIVEKRKKVRTEQN